METLRLRQDEIQDRVVYYFGGKPEPPDLGAGDVREQRLDLALPSSPFRIAPLKSYRAIKTMRFDLLDDGGNAVNVRIIDRDPVLGPLVQPVDATLAGAAATVNATIEGY